MVGLVSLYLIVFIGTEPRIKSEIISGLCHHDVPVTGDSLEMVHLARTLWVVLGVPGPSIDERISRRSRCKICPSPQATDPHNFRALS